MADVEEIVNPTLAVVLETVTGAHYLIVHFLGEDDYRDGVQFVEVYALRRTCVQLVQAVLLFSLLHPQEPTPSNTSEEP